MTAEETVNFAEEHEMNLRWLDEKHKHLELLNQFF
jgi:hypothetical protein